MTSRERHLWVCYRITEADYATILAHQNGVCAGCLRSPGRIRFAVDHCHRTGLIRGLLCWPCNRALGILRDNQTATANLAGYLAAPPAPLALGKEVFGLIGRAKASKKTKVYGGPEVALGKKQK